MSVLVNQTCWKEKNASDKHSHTDGEKGRDGDRGNKKSMKTISAFVTILLNNSGIGMMRVLVQPQ